MICRAIDDRFWSLMLHSIGIDVSEDYSYFPNSTPFSAVGEEESAR